MITYRYYNKEFLIENKLNEPGVLILLDTIFNWIFSKKHPEYRIINDKICFYISQQYLSTLLDSIMNFVTISRKFSLLRNCGLINKESQTIDRKVYYSFNWDIVEKCLANEEELKEVNYKNNWLQIISRYKNCNIDSYNYIKKEKKVLFNPNERKGYSIESEMIVKKLVKNNRNLFTTRLPEDYPDGKITKTFISACVCIQDIYNGNFINPRIYPFTDNFLNNKEFYIPDYKKIIGEVKGDWVKVRQLLFRSIENLKLMYNEDRMPFKKSKIPNNIGNWLYDTFSIPGEKQSYFVLSLEEPPVKFKQLSEKKADRIYDALSKAEKISANKLYELCPKGESAGTFFENVQKMIEWGKQVTEVEMNSKYWFGQSSELPSLFADYCKENKITVNASTVDIEKAVNCNGPWVWFVKQASQEHNMNENLCDCVTSEDLIDCYSHHSLSFDNMNEIVF